MMKQKKSLTKEQYLRRFSRSARWLALTVAVLCAIVAFWLRSMSLDWGADELRDYFFPRMIAVGIVGLVGTGVALC